MNSDKAVRWWCRITPVLMVFVVAVPAISLLIFYVAKSREAARQTVSLNKLKQFGIAFLSYHETFQTLPPGGTFKSDGTPLHGWYMHCLPFIESTPYYDMTDLAKPWDDPANLDVYREFLNRSPCIVDPSVPQTFSEDGFRLAHYSVNQNLVFRNAGSRLTELSDPQQTLLIGDAFENFDLLASTYNWRDPSIPLADSRQAFGRNVRDVSMLTMTDGSVRTVAHKIDPAIVQTWAGPTRAQRLTAKPNGPYRWKPIPYRRRALVGEKSGAFSASLELTADKKELRINFTSRAKKEFLIPDEWSKKIASLTADASVERVTLRGLCIPAALRAVIALPRLQELDVTEVEFVSDPTAVLQTARSGLKTQGLPEALRAGTEPKR